jgi:hypothetical protein
MEATRTIRFAVAALALVLAAPASAAPSPPACGEGKIAVRGECVAACPAKGPFADASCACPPGTGKVLFGTGGGECQRLVCAKGMEVDPKLCDCPEGYVAKASKKKGKATCVQPKGTATAAAK